MSESPDLTTTLKLLSDQTRLRILTILQGNELTVKELTEVLQLGQSTLSTQLGQLKEGLLLNARKEGQFVYYRMGRFEPSTFIAGLIEQVLSEFEHSDWHQTDKRKLGEVLARRHEASLSFFNAHKTQNQLSPGQTWESLSIGLIQLIHGQRIVDLGCGIGRMAAMFSDAGNHVVGVDNSNEQISLAIGLHPASDRLQFQCAPMEATGLPAHHFDIAIVSQALHHAAQPSQAIREAGRLLRPGGQILILDLVRHSQDWIQDRFADFWLGFDPTDIQTWLYDAEFINSSTRICGPDPEYPGIETMIISAEKP